MPDWLKFKQEREAQRDELIHSAKGSTWKKHKYTSIVTTISGKKRYIYAATKKKGEPKTSEKIEKYTYQNAEYKRRMDNLIKERDQYQKDLSSGRQKYKVGSKEYEDVQNKIKNLNSDIMLLKKAIQIWNRKIEKLKLAAKKDHRG